MIEILLTQGHVALVDAADAERVNAHKWCTLTSGKNLYAVRKVRRPAGGWTNQSLHRFLLHAEAGTRVGHLDGNGLNCVRANLYLASRGERTPREQAALLRTHRTQRVNKSGFIGVSWDSRANKWRAQIEAAGRKKHIGYYLTAEDAAHARDRVARDLHGAQALLNFAGESA